MTTNTDFWPMEHPQFTDDEHKAVQEYIGMQFPNTRQAFIDLYLSSKKFKDTYWKFTERKRKSKEALYKYLLTFTLRQELWADQEQIGKAEQYIKDQINRDALGFVKFAYVQEIGKGGNPHFHVSCETTKPIKSNRFCQYEKVYGHVDVSRTKGKSSAESLNYISKQNAPIVLL